MQYADSATQRYYILVERNLLRLLLYEVVTKQEAINTDLWLLAWQVRTYSWNDLWFGLVSKSEGANFWLEVLSDLQNRGIRDILICCVDGLKGFPDAIQYHNN